MTNNAIHSRKYEKIILTLFFLCWGFVFFDQTALSILFPLITEELSLTTTQIGQISMAQMIGFSVSAPIIGMLVDRIQYKKMALIFSAVGTSVFCIFTTFANSFEYLIVVRILLGVCEGAVLPVMITILTAISVPKRFGRNVGIVYAGNAVIASTLGPIIATQLASLTNWRITFFIIAVPTIIVAFFLMFILKEPEMAKAEQQNEEKGSVWLQIVKNRNVMLCLFIAMLAFSGVWITLTYMPTYLTAGAGLSVGKMGLIMTLSGAVTILWQIIVPAVSDKIGRKPTLVGFYVFSLLSPIVLYLFGGSTIAIILYVAFGGVCLSITAIFNSIIPVESVNPKLVTTVTSLIQGLGQLVGSLMVGFAGAFADAKGISVILLLIICAFGACAVVGTILIETNPRKAKVVAQESQTA